MKTYEACGIVQKKGDNHFRFAISGPVEVKVHIVRSIRFLLFLFNNFTFFVQVWVIEHVFACFCLQCVQIQDISRHFYKIADFQDFSRSLKMNFIFQDFSRLFKTCTNPGVVTLSKGHSFCQYWNETQSWVNVILLTFLANAKLTVTISVLLVQVRCIFHARFYFTNWIWLLRWYER